jgi:hypothetical protein
VSWSPSSPLSNSNSGWTIIKLYWRTNLFNFYWWPTWSEFRKASKKMRLESKQLKNIERSNPMATFSSISDVWSAISKNSKSIISSLTINSRFPIIRRDSNNSSTK